MNQFIVERFEGPWVVVEYGDVLFNFPKDALPEDVKEGDVLRFDIVIDKRATEERSRYIKGLADELFRDC